MNRILMRIVEEFAAFLDLADEKQIDPDFAQLGRDRLRTLVDDLSDSEKGRLAQFLLEEAVESDGSYRDWIVGLPERLGLDAT